MTEQIYAFTYKPSPTAAWRIGSLWAKDVEEAKRMAKSALNENFPGYAGGKLFRASSPTGNRNSLPIPDPDSDGYLTPKMALERERQRMGAMA